MLTADYADTTDGSNRFEPQKHRGTESDQGREQASKSF
jgi:hypothetical protein